MIKFDNKSKVFHIQTTNTSYILKLYGDYIVEHMYWGKRIDGLEGINHFKTSAAFTALDAEYKDSEYGDGISTELIPQEYPTFGSCDMRKPAFHAMYEDGSRITKMKYVSHKIYKGKPKLKGLPGVYCENDSEADTLEITMQDNLTGLVLICKYTAMNDYDAICRSVEVVNEGTQKIDLKSVMSCNVDFKADEFEFINLSGAWIRERHIEKRKLHTGTTKIESRRGSSSHHHSPFFALADNGTNENTGNVYGFSFVYSGNFEAIADGADGEKINSLNEECMMVGDIIKTYDKMSGDVLYAIQGLYDMFIKNSNIYKMKENFEEYAMRILNRGVGRAGKRTIECYRTGLVPVVKKIGHMRIADITKDQLIELFNDLSYDYSDSSLSKSFLGTRWIFNEAYDDEPFLKNPFDKLKCPASEKPEGEEREPYTDEELQDLFIKAKKYRNKIVYPMLTIYECTGMRPAELRALEWKNYDRDSKTLYVRNAVITVYDKITDMRKKPKAYEKLSKPKSKYGIRPLLLSDIAVAALDEWRKELDAMPEKMKNSNFIFPSKDGGFKSETSVKTIMQRFVAKCGLEDVGFMQYRFRHTVCTRLLTAGLSVPVVQRILGDNTPNVIYNVYYHLSNKKLFEVYAEYFKNQDLRYIDIYKNNYEEADGESVS